jgi:F0F1-type ATP synthase membrane subunit b/b'
MEVSISAVVAQIINFGIMFWIFNKFASKPLSKSIEDRKILLKKLKTADKAYDEKLEIAKLEARDIVQD